MKNISYGKFLILGSLCMLTLFAFGLMATMPAWQPPICDSTINGDGTHEDPLGVNVPIVFAATISQASTSNPTAVEYYNGIDPSAFTYTRDSIGSYKIEGSDTAFADTTRQYIATLGASALTALGVKWYRATDSTLLIKVMKSTGYGVDLAGDLHVIIVESSSDE